MGIRDRQRRIIEHVTKVGVASVEELSQLFGVSEMTIRRDIEHLDRSNLVMKVKGGAQRRGEIVLFHEAHLRARMKLNVEAKQRLAEKAATMVESGDSVFLDGSTTIICLARALARADQSITVITNSVLVSLELADTRHVQLINPGGVLDRDTFTFSPVAGEEAFVEYHVKKAFLSCAAIMIDEGTYENSVFNIGIKRNVVRNAETVYLLVDASKLGQRALHRVIGIDEIDVIVTENVLTEEELARLKRRNIAVHFI
jgi:DeoR/GlpR family transcriptional regulator of sugar metabolism